MNYLINYYVEGSVREAWTDDYNTAWEIAMLLETAAHVERVIVHEQKSGFHPIYDSGNKNAR
jgi:hypothetical protein